MADTPQTPTVLLPEAEVQRIVAELAAQIAPVVDDETVASYRIWYETRDAVSESSCATREAMDIAATRRGCVIPIIPGFSRVKLVSNTQPEIVITHRYQGDQNQLHKETGELGLSFHYLFHRR